MSKTKRQSARQQTERIAAGALILLLLAGPAQAVVYTNATGVVLDVARQTLSPTTPTLIDIQQTWGDAILYGELFTAGLQVERNESNALPVEVTITPLRTGQCVDELGAVAGAFTLGESDEEQYTLMPPMYAHVEHLVGGSFTTHVTTDWSGTVAHDPSAQHPGSILHCRVSIFVKATAGAALEQNEVVQFLITSLVPTQNMEMFVGAFEGTDSPGVWNGNPHISKTETFPGGGPVDIFGTGANATFYITAGATFVDLGHDTHDDDYMEVTLPGHEARIVNKGKDLYTSVLLSVAPERPNRQCVNATIYDDDMWQDDDLVSSSICEVFRYTQVNPGPKSGISVPPIQPSLPDACTRVIVSDVAGVLDYARDMPACLRALDAQLTGGAGAPVFDVLDASLAEAEAVVEQVVQTPAPILLPDVALEVDGERIIAQYIVSP